MGGIEMKILVLLCLTSNACAINIDGFLDSVLPECSKELRDEGFDPLLIPDEYWMDYSVGGYPAKLGFFGGQIFNLSTIRRKSEATAEFNISTTSIDVKGPVVVPLLKVNYSYVAKAFNMGPSGTILADVTELSGHFILSVNLPSMKLVLKETKLENVKDLSAVLTGFGGFSAAASGIAQSFALYFKSVILDKLSDVIYQQSAPAVSNITRKQLLDWGFSMSG